MSTDKKQILLSDLKASVEAGLKKDALCEKYGLNKAQMTGLLKKAGLKIRKFHEPKFELVNDEPNVASDTTAVTADNF